MKTGSKFIIIICLIFVAILLFLMSPVFSVEEIAISGNERFSQAQILDMAGVEQGMNIFKVKYNNIQKKLLENTYIKYAEVITTLPDKMTIEVVERKICGYVPYMGTYLYIDQDGYVLENLSDTDVASPIVTGLKFREFSVGGKLTVENKNSFDVVMMMSKLLINYGFLDSVKEMNISNPEDIHLYVGNVDILFGSVADADKKLRTAIEIMKTISGNDRGVLHLENANETPYFTHTLQ